MKRNGEARVMDDTVSKEVARVLKVASKIRTEKMEVHDVPKPETMEIPIKGIAPFLSHKKSNELSQEWEDKLTGKGKKRTVINPEAMWEASLYRHPETKEPCILGRAMKSSIVEACQKYWEKGTWTRINGSVFVVDEFIPIKYKRMEKRRDFLPIKGRGATNSYRVAFHDWTAVIKIRYDANYVNPSQILNLLSRAGFSIGVGDDRPGKGKGGIMGTFVVDA